jgi:hypothetical protein
LVSLLLERVTFFARAKKVTEETRPQALVLRMPSAVFAANGSSRPVGKDKCRGNPKGKRAGVPFLLVTFLWAGKDKFIRNEFVLRSTPEGQITGM